MARIRVAVCSNRPAAAVAECLSALIEQGAKGMLVLSALGEGAAAQHRAALPPEWLLLREHRTGLSHARNRALAECADSEVLAFLDDDAIAGPGWLDALTAAWRDAPDSVGCIGGPIRPRFAVPRPAWLGDELLPNLTVLDLGPSPRDLDPEVEPLYGANISFRAGALRRAGGFDPAFGHQGARAYFGEEVLAQVALARRGGGIRYTPDAVVDHVIPAERLTRASVLRRRFAYGRMLRATGARGRGVAARQALRSAIGVPVAVRRGDRAQAMLRAVRVVENAGALSASLGGH